MSIVPGFEHDIFISYRHNDNKSGWVTEFVNALNEELGSTIKEPLSIYFDKNPHDGLLETHHVDKSLEGKIKSLIFIPIISQTYCDPKSFAWLHEFCAFNKLSKEDQFGTDIRLSNGNVASRILPIKIHDLDTEDKSTIENEIATTLRAIDFIYTEPGVNRPLKPADSKADNQNRTDYRNQVNKVANAIKDIVAGVRNPPSISPRTNVSKQPKKNLTLRKSSLIFVASLLTVAIYFFFQQKTLTDGQLIELDKSIAVLPFVDMSPGKDQEYLGDGIAEGIITELSRIKELKVIGRTSSFQFKGEKIDLRDVGEKLNVSSVLEGSVMKSGNKIRITAQLINVSDGAHLWAEHYDKPMDDIFAIHDQISKAISDKMKVTLLANHTLSDKKPTSSSEAYENYLRGNQILLPGRGKEAMPFFEKAIQLDPGYADAYAGLAWSHFFSWEQEGEERFDKMLPLAMKVLELDPGSEKSHALLYVIYWTYKWDWKVANEEYQKYLTINPLPLIGHGLHKAQIMGDVKGGIDELGELLEIDPINRDVLRLLGYVYAWDKQYVKAKEAVNKAIEMDPNYDVAYAALTTVNILAGEYDLALQTLARLDKIEKPKNIEPNFYRIWALVLGGRTDEARKIYDTMDLSKSQTESGVRLNFSSKARIEFWMGHLDEGFRYLEEALKQKERDVLTIRLNPGFDQIRSHPRFQEFMKRVPFPPHD